MAIINRETDYAIRILRVLRDGQRHSIREICQSQHMTKPFTYKISKKLERAGYIRVLRGVEGGCQLACDLACVNLHQLMAALEEDEVLVACMESGYTCEYAAKAGCRVHRNLSQLQQRINEQLQSYSIAKLFT